MHSNQQIHMSKFNPNAEYKWNPNEEFTITGQEYGILRLLVRNVMECDEVGRVVYGMEVDKILGKIYKDGIESGKITEVPEEKLIRPNSSIVSTTGETLITA